MKHLGVNRVIECHAAFQEEMTRAVDARRKRDKAHEHGSQDEVGAWGHGAAA